MPSYLLDTNIVSYLADPSSLFHEPVADRIESLPQGSLLSISLLTLYELAYGYARDPRHSRLLAIIHETGIDVLSPSEAGAEVFASLKNVYRLHTGTREAKLVRHNIDLILASTAIVEDDVHRLQRCDLREARGTRWPAQGRELDAIGGAAAPVAIPALLNLLAEAG